MVLFLFVIMFLNLKKETESQKSNISKFAAVIAGGLLMLVMIAALKDVDAGTYTEAGFDNQIGMVQNLGMVLFKQYLLPFELASVLFLVAMAGAVMLGKRETGERHF